MTQTQTKQLITIILVISTIAYARGAMFVGLAGTVAAFVLIPRSRKEANK